MKLECQRVVFTGKAEACLEDASLGHDLGPDQILLQTRWSLISPETELAIYTNQRDFGASPHPFPVYPGYAAMGVVQAVGAAVAGFTPGDRVFAISGHASHTVISPANSFCLRLPDDLRDDFAPFIRMMLISLASLCRADIQPGEWSGVVGLGLVGNLAAQMGRCAGYNVIGAGRSEMRSEVARRCGLRHVLSGEPEEVAAHVGEITGGRGCQLVLDTTGTSQGLMKAVAVAMAGIGASTALVGVPWQSDPTVAATAFMQPAFSKYLTLKGGWEWCLPIYERPGSPLKMVNNRSSIETNARYALELIRNGSVQIEPLITHRYKPGDAQAAYQGLLQSRDGYLGVLFDWNGVGG